MPTGLRRFLASPNLDRSAAALPRYGEVERLLRLGCAGQAS